MNNNGESTPAFLSILVVCGVRPQFVKCAAFHKGIIAFNENFGRQVLVKFINSGQHYDDELAGTFIRELELSFDYTVTHENRNPGHIFGEIISKISDFIALQPKKPDWVVVFGDANTTLAAAIAANKSKCNIAHFEAGTAVKKVRTPEVTNGIILSHLADVQFCSTELAANSLKRQGINSNLYIVGDVAREFVIEYAHNLQPGLMGCRDYILVTLHHEETLDSKSNIENLLADLGDYEKVFFVAHPRTKQKLIEWGVQMPKNIELIHSLSYRDMLSAIKGCRFLVTDSGGLQREAYYLGKRCLVSSDVDFWPALRLAGVHRKITTKHRSILAGLRWIERKISIEDYPSVPSMDKSDVIYNALSTLFRLTENTHG